ncbi:hypothetical protein ACIOJD_15985 [Streptomyces sp. NPDC088116]|uniref:COG4315 family predicted lipoprotein n=1 Tax=Streptomyces sp. NPDC088116 TaxID=3365825 RepID=UPI003819E3FC
MRSNTRTAATAVAAAVLCAAALAGCSDNGGGGSASKSEEPADYVAASGSASVGASPSASVDVGKVSAMSGPLGKVLVDGRGHTLYLFEADKKNKSNCSGECTTEWPPLIVSGKPSGGTGGVKASWLSTITRSDGKKQVVYNGVPLYTFDQDKKPGEFKGQGLNAFGAKWYVLGVDGKKIITPLPSKSPSASPSGSSSMSPSASASGGASPSGSASSY